MPSTRLDVLFPESIPLRVGLSSRRARLTSLGCGQAYMKRAQPCRQPVVQETRDIKVMQWAAWRGDAQSPPYNQG